MRRIQHPALAGILLLFTLLLAAAREGTDTDMTRDHEYTDWDAVDHFAQDAYSLIAGVAAA